MPTTEARRLADFAGTWQLKRMITPEVGPHARFEGQAVWSSAEGGLDYREQGVMTLDGQAPMQAERRYFWAEDLSVFFDDGRYFHRVPAHGGTDHHWCAPDSYSVTYQFENWPRFRVLWDVSGPRKAYHSNTEYARC